VTLISR